MGNKNSSPEQKSSWSDYFSFKPKSTVPASGTAPVTDNETVTGNETVESNETVAGNENNNVIPMTNPNGQGGNANNNDKIVAVKLWAGWCGHCQSLEPTWNSLTNYYSKNPKVVFEHVEDKKMKGGLKDLSKKYNQKMDEPEGYPTIYIFRSSCSSKPMPYQGMRDFESMKQKIEELLVSESNPHKRMAMKTKRRRHRRHKINTMKKNI